MTTLYETLGVAADASVEEIKNAYRRAAMRWHPDRNPDNLQEAEAKFKAVAHAYAVLSNVTRRSEYDASLKGRAKEAQDDAAQGQEDADRVFFLAMIELALSMAYRGYNRDMLFGALISEGCPDALAAKIADEAIAHLKAQRGASKKAAMRSDSEKKNLVSSAKAVMLALTVVGILFAVLAGQSRQPVPSAASAQSFAPAKAEPVPVVRHQVFVAVAAIQANVRADASAKSRVLQTLSRGKFLEVEEERGDFFRIRLQDGKTGWISKTVVVSNVTASRLQAMSAQTYMQHRETQALLKNFGESLSSHVNWFQVALAQIRQGEVVSAPNFSVNAIGGDQEAAIWFGLEARWHADREHTEQAFNSALAAAAANPADVDRWMALGFAAAAANQADMLETAAFASLLQSPTSTNAWVLVGAHAALEKDIKLLEGAVAQARKYSRNPKVTQSFLNKFSASLPPAAAVLWRMAIQPLATPVDAASAAVQ